MKILAISDEECPALWDYYTPGKLNDYDLIISCGDLKASYLSFLVTMARCPLLYVHGNHDENYERRPPEGCDCIEDRLVTVYGTTPATTSIPRKKCAAASTGCASKSGKPAVWTL